MKVRFLIVGGYSLAYHGYPRYTKDLDIWVLASPEGPVVEFCRRFASPDPMGVYWFV